MPPATLIGFLHPSNRDAIAWNENGLIAFGCHSTLVFFDVRTLDIFQTLEQHNTAINLVCWRSHDDLLKKNQKTLSDCASSDISGNIIVWDVLSAHVRASFRHLNSPVSDMRWFCWPDSERDLLLSLHSCNFVILWDVARKERLWEHKFNNTLLFKFAIDPFDPSNIAFASTGSSILLVQNVTPTKWPSTTESISSLQLESKTIKSSGQTQQKSSESAAIQLKFHPASQHLLFVLFPNEICLVETQHRQLIYSAVIDTGSPLAQIMPCARRDAFFLVHQNGLISLRCAQFHLSDERMHASLDYGRLCVNEPYRQSMRTRLMGAVLCPVTQSTMALLMNTGRIIIYQLETNSRNIEPYRMRSIEDLLPQTIEDITPAGIDHQTPQDSQLRLSQYGMYNPLGASVTVVRMRPMDLVDNLSLDCEGIDPSKSDNAPPTPLDSIVHLAAVGNSSGVVHLVDVFAGRIERDLQVHSCPVKCLEWCGLDSLISAAYLASLSASSSLVRNDIFAVDIHTGVKRRIRPEQEESPVEMIRVSHYSSYLAISFRNEPLEIWDLRALRLLRRMSKRCPVIVDMAWSTKHHQLRAVNEKTQIHRENLVVLDNDNHLYHVVVKGLHVRDGKEVSTQWKSGAAFLRCMVWKDDVLAFGDSAGRVGVWDLAKTQCRQSGLSNSTRGPVHRVVFSRLAGDYTLAAQHPTSIVVWDTERLHAICSFQRPGHSIIDIDMCGLTPIYIASDGMFRFAIWDNENGRNTSLPDSDTPLLLRSSYRRVLFSLIPSDSDRTITDELNIDHDNAQFFDRLAECRSSLSRAIFIHQFIGDLQLADFCRIAEKAIGAHLSHGKGGEEEEQKSTEETLPSNLFLFWDKAAYQKRMEHLTRTLLSMCRSERQLELAIEKCIIMRKNELAMFYLLNNDQPMSTTSTRSDMDVRLNAFRACTLAANFDNEESRCLVKLTATNLIAANFVSEGIQLLSLIDQALDACKYLISQGLWQQSLAYSKMSPQCDVREIFTRNADHLATEAVGRKSSALLFYANLACWERCRTLIVETSSENRAKLEQILKLVERQWDE